MDIDLEFASVLLTASLHLLRRLRLASSYILRRASMWSERFENLIKQIHDDNKN